MPAVESRGAHSGAHCGAHCGRRGSPPEATRAVVWKLSPGRTQNAISPDIPKRTASLEWGSREGNILKSLTLHPRAKLRYPPPSPPTDDGVRGEQDFSREASFPVWKCDVAASFAGVPPALPSKTNFMFSNRAPPPFPPNNDWAGVGNFVFRKPQEQVCPPTLFGGGRGGGGRVGS